ncbi:DUF2752 domain-containing protein [bacterium]|nr:DUF2752 domain-containing protein [bacterium]
MFEVRPLAVGRPSSSDRLELLLLAIVFVLSFATPAYTASGQPNAPGMEVLEKATGGGLCPFRRLTGIPCAGCGLTRGFVQLAHAHLQEALHQNPLTPIVFLWLAARLLGFASVCFLKRELSNRIPWKIAWRFYEAFFVAGLALGVWRVYVHFNN